jgi:hypothetical protein
MKTWKSRPVSFLFACRVATRIQPLSLVNLHEDWLGSIGIFTPFLVFVCGIIFLGRKPDPAPFTRLFAWILVWLTKYTYALSRVCLRHYFVGSKTSSSPFHSFVCMNIGQGHKVHLRHFSCLFAALFCWVANLIQPLSLVCLHEYWFGSQSTLTPFLVFVCGIILLGHKPHPAPFTRLFAWILVRVTKYTYAISRVCLRHYFFGSKTTSNPFYEMKDKSYLILKSSRFSRGT